MTSTGRFLVASLASLLFVATASAHHGNGGSGWLAGLAHPFTGADHLLTMLAVGLLAARIGGRATAILPTAFLGGMAVGGVVGIRGISLPAVETLIAASVIAVGLALALRRTCSVPLAAVGVGLFAIAHGYAHGAELPLTVNSNQFTFGVLAATAILLGAGVAIGRWALRREVGLVGLRLSGIAVVMIGAAMVFAAER